MCESIKRTTKNAYLYLFISLIGIVIFSYSTVRLDALSDDGGYLRMIAENPGFYNYISFTYRALNGRVVANSLMYVMLQINFLPLWVAISAFATISIAYNISRMFGKPVTLKNMTVVLGLMMCMGFRVLSSSMLWFTGAIFYLWPVAILIYLLAQASNRFYRKTTVTFSWRYALEVFLGVTLMLWSEQAALVLLGFWILQIIHHLVVEKQKSNVWEFLAVGLWIACFLLMFLAPSQRIRMNNVYGYAALEGGVGYLLQNGIYWTFQSIFKQQRILVLLFGLLTLLCANRNKHPILLRCFKMIWCIPLLSILMQGILFLLHKNASHDLFTFFYLPDAGYTLLNLLPYLYWTLYAVVLFILYFVNIEKKIFTGFILLASLATLVLMWFSTTMYASGNRTCMLFCIGMVALLTKLLLEKNKTYEILILGIGIPHLLSFSILLAVNFVIHY